MTDVEVIGLTPDGQRVVLQLPDRTLEVRLAEVHRAEREHQRPAATATASETTEPLTPKLIQRRIRCGESAEQVARTGGWPVEVVARYEGPILAEREHHAGAARQVEVDGQSVEALVASHFGQAADELEWDSWLVGPGQWEVRASGAERSVVLRWEPAGRTVKAVDEASRRVLRQATADDALTAVLRPLSTRASTGAAEAPPRPARRSRAEVPLWDDISRQVTGNETSHPEHRA